MEPLQHTMGSRVSADKDRAQGISAPSPDVNETKNINGQCKAEINTEQNAQSPDIKPTENIADQNNTEESKEQNAPSPDIKPTENIADQNNTEKNKEQNAPSPVRNSKGNFSDFSRDDVNNVQTAPSPEIDTTGNLAEQSKAEINKEQHAPIQDHINAERNENKDEIKENEDTTEVKLNELPLAHREADGKKKFYEEGYEPTLLAKEVTDDDKIRNKDAKILNEDAQANYHKPHDTRDNIDNPFEEAGDDNAVVNEVLYSEANTITDAARIIGTDGPDIAYKNHKPPTIGKRDLIPDDDFFEEIDAHAKKAPKLIKEHLSSLVSYLTEIAATPLDKVRAFYVWITHNINYDTSGYFGRAVLQPTDPAAVLQRRLTVCEGYARLMKAFCREVDIPVKIISGFVKAYGYMPGNDVTQDSHSAHAWNAVFLENNWFLLDVTWGAGYVKTQQKTYIPQFNDVYFLTNPDIFITDHFPFMNNDIKMSERWQLLQTPFSKEEFIDALNMDKHGKQWGIEAISHKYCIISYVQHETDIQIQHTYEPMSDYLAFLYKDDRKLDQFTYTYKLDARLANIHVCMPATGEYSLQIFGRRKVDSVNSYLQPLMKYVLYCTEAYASPMPYPANHTMYGPVPDLETYGMSDVGKVCHIADEGEVIISMSPTRYIDPLPRLYYGENNAELNAHCFVNFSEDARNVNIHIRLPYSGYFKLVLFGKQNEGAQLKPFVTYLIHSKVPARDGVFPVSREPALRYKCCLVEPLTKYIPANTEIPIQIISRFLHTVKGHTTYLPRINKMTFKGKVLSPAPNSRFVIYGAVETDSDLQPLFIFNTV